MFEKYVENMNPSESIKKIMQEKNVSRAEATKILRRKIPDESYFQKKIIEGLKKNYPAAFITKITLSAYSEAGIPDILFILDGHYFGFEVKKPVFGKPTKLQEVAIKRINAAGGTAAVVSYPEECYAIIEKWRN